MDAITERKRKRFQFLQCIYEETVADPQKTCDPYDIGNELGLSRPESWQITKYLRDKGLIQNRSANTGNLIITTAGITEVESALSKPDEPTKYFPANVVNNIINVEGSVTDSPIQQGTQDSTQTVSYSEEVIEKTQEFVELLKSVLSEIPFEDDDDKAEIQAEVATIES